MPTSVLIVCDVRLYREGLRRSLEERWAVEVAGMSDALERVHVLSPEVVLLDVGTAGGVELFSALATGAPLVRVVAVGVTEDPSAILEFVEAGAAAYVAKDASLEDLVEAVEAALRGEVLCSPRIAGWLFRRVASLAGERSPEVELDALTQRELEILGLIERGLSNKEIARRLRVKVATVKNHVHNILRKLGVSRRGAAAALLRGGRLPKGARPGPWTGSP